MGITSQRVFSGTNSGTKSKKSTISNRGMLHIKLQVFLMAIEIIKCICSKIKILKSEKNDLNFGPNLVDFHQKLLTTINKETLFKFIIIRKQSER